MVSSSCKRLSRLELVYSVNARFVKALNKSNKEIIPENCKAYLEKEHKNETIYRTKDNESESKLETLLKHTHQLYCLAQSLGDKYVTMEEYLLLERVLREQTQENETGELSPLSGEEISSESLQNPTDPDATYRKKYKDNVGYVANMVQSYDNKNQVITHYDLKKNTYSDVQFADDIIEKLSKDKSDDETTRLLVDGGYYSGEIIEKGLEANIKIIPSDVPGRKPKISYSEFKVSKETQKITECPGGQSPVESYYNDKKSTYTAKFDKNQCEQCPLLTNCPIKKQKKKNVIKFSKKRYEIDKLRIQMGTKEYRQITNERAGVEGVPSVLRRRYQIDSMPVRGLVRSKIWLGFKIMASNMKALLKGINSNTETLCFFFYLILMRIFFGKESKCVVF